MDQPLLTALTALDQSTTSLAHDAEQLAHASAAPLTPSSPGVQSLFAQATDITRTGASLAAAAGWNDLSVEQQALGHRIVSTATHAARTATQLLGTGPQFHAEVTTSVTDPHSAASTAVWNDVRAGRDLPNVRIVGTLDHDAAAGVADLFAHLPSRVVQQLDAEGARSTLFSGKLTDVWGYHSLRGVHPRGWPAGSTWDTVPGVGATGPGGLHMAANPMRDHNGQGHGSNSLALHELGHVVDEVLAPPVDDHITDDPAWLNGPEAEVRADPTATDYVRSYPEEWFAESLVAYTWTPASNRELSARYPRTAAFLASTLGTPRFPSQSR